MTVFYRDVSHYNGAYVPVGPTCAKATEGSGYVDPAYAGIRSRTLAGGWPFLPYHFLRPHTIASIASQVAHVIAVVGRRSIMLDVEKEPLDTLAEQRELRDDMYAFADQYQAQGGRVTLAYFPRWQEQAIGSPSLTGLTARGIGLVSSNYTTYSDNGPGWAAYGGVTPIIWQFASTPLDVNAFKGTTTELADLWAHGIDSSSNPSVPVVPPEAFMTTADDFVKILDDPRVQVRMRAYAWQFAGNPLTSDKSTATMFNDLWLRSGASADADKADATRDAALATDIAETAGDDATRDAAINAALSNINDKLAALSTGGGTVDMDAVRTIVNEEITTALNATHLATS